VPLGILNFNAMKRQHMFSTLHSTNNSKFCYAFFGCIFLLLLGSSCEKVIDVKVQQNVPTLVVEAYINNEIPQYNYVVLSRSLDYFAPSFQSIAVKNALVTITEGDKNANNEYVWNVATTKRLSEVNNPTIPALFRNGVYFDSMIFVNRNLALKGTIGKYYLLQIEEGGNSYSAITTLINPVPIDSISIGFEFLNDSNQRQVRITNNYKDPDTLGNAQFYFWRNSSNNKSFGWGGFTKSRAPGNDDLSNGEYIRLTHPQGFSVNDTVNYFMASVTRDVYKFWDSYNKARDNNGAFSTPVSLLTNISGPNVTGCFSGFAVSSKTIITR
jgi:hypothetical protein